MDARGEHVIHLELGRPDFDTPQVIKEAAYKSLEKGKCILHLKLRLHGTAYRCCRKAQGRKQHSL